jgi:hypothetical protein
MFKTALSIRTVSCFFIYHPIPSTKHTLDLPNLSGRCIHDKQSETEWRTKGYSREVTTSTTLLSHKEMVVWLSKKSLARESG